MTKLKTLDKLAGTLYSRLYSKWDEQTSKESRKEYKRLPIERKRMLKNAIMWLKYQPVNLSIETLFPEFYVRTWARENSREFEEYRKAVLIDPEGEVGNPDCWYYAIRKLRRYFSKVLPK